MMLKVNFVNVSNWLIWFELRNFLFFFKHQTFINFPLYALILIKVWYWWKTMHHSTIFFLMFSQCEVIDFYFLFLSHSVLSQATFGGCQFCKLRLMLMLSVCCAVPILSIYLLNPENGIKGSLLCDSNRSHFFIVIVLVWCFKLFHLCKKKHMSLMNLHKKKHGNLNCQKI